MAKHFALLACLLCYTWMIQAQDTSHHPVPDTAGHLAHQTPGKPAKTEKKRLEYFRDTIRRERRKFDSTFFSDIKVPTTGDYARALGNVYQTMTDIPSDISSFDRLPSIGKSLDLDDSALEVVNTRMSQNDRTFNVRNLQMINTLLDVLDKNTDDYSDYLDQCDSTLEEVRNNISDLRKDTLMRAIFRDSSLRNAFQPQLQLLKEKWREIDSLVTEDGRIINTLKSQASAHSMLIGELIAKVDLELKAVGTRAFAKEQPFLWEEGTRRQRLSADDYKESIGEERAMTKFYFTNTRSNRSWLLIMGLVFFLWVAGNFRTLKRLHKLDVVGKLGLSNLGPIPVGATLIFMLSLAPFYDMHAPAIYIESVQLLSMIVVTFMLRKKKVPAQTLFGWVIFVVLFLLLPVTRILLPSTQIQRWATLLINSAALLLGVYYITHLKKTFGKWTTFAVGLYLLLNLLAVICNLTSRVTLSQIFGYTAAYAFAQIVSLTIFTQVVVESFLLQVQTSRLRKRYPEAFEVSSVSKSVRRFSMIVAVIIWLIVFTINLNLFDALNDVLVEFFTKVRKVGNFNFSIGGILLFMGIIWAANFLQKYISYFFGDTGDDAAFDDKGQRSRLMVTRLILLIVGFLLAVAASGLAVDRITVILGALGVGVGLGLQNIVNNFVSGIILIFDRPLRIGDTVDIGDKRGRVKEIGIRAITLLTEDGAEVIIPTGDVLSHNIVNWTLSNNHARVALSFTMDKPENADAIDLDGIRKLIQENHNVLQQRAPEVSLNAVNTKTVELRIFFWIVDFNKEGATAAEVKTAIYRFFEEKGIVIA
ncbi:mechanosensitive ion channel family protein [Dinghuibacter silviterrae]|uniref:Mechanosensitive ion channel-like protein n=1 Tax=Dinghuibacter silviterrae TaxID=1539049 RepID=A0A4R8DG43_9BACT|nr:mechanosensitive ion channel domain-containing protein [Dinghuibacter silviterrae]TDW95930.1 mechanosensitive ion channel-like protein [Dinghuibacter silviterrae]